MKRVAEYTGLKIPDWALSYIVNADDSGITPEDKKLVDEYLEQFQDEAKEVGGHYIFGIETYESDYQEEKEKFLEELSIDLGEDDDYTDYSYFSKRLQEVIMMKKKRNQDKESYFTWNTEFGLASTVVDCTILIVK